MKFFQFRNQWSYLIVFVTLFLSGKHLKSDASPVTNSMGSGFVDLKYADVPPEGSFPWNPKWNTYIAQAIADFGGTLIEGSNQPFDDIQSICPGYSGASRDEKSAFWALFFASFARYESGFDPNMRFKEDSSLKNVYSEGLLQLSYGDEKNHANCPLSKSEGNILFPRENLRCGVAIMVNQVKSCQCLFTSKHYYWAVLTSKKSDIRRDFKQSAGKLGFCN
jgi:hypothetical protein